MNQQAATSDISLPVKHLQCPIGNRADGGGSRVIFQPLNFSVFLVTEQKKGEYSHKIQQKIVVDENIKKTQK